MAEDDTSQGQYELEWEMIENAGKEDGPWWGFDDDPELGPLATPIDVVEINMNRGAIVGADPAKLKDYVATFVSVDPDGDDNTESIEFKAFDDRHAVNKAKKVLEISIPKESGWQYGRLSVTRIDSVEIYDEEKASASLDEVEL